jgi:tRNA pseudouridine38-40 synthase
MEIYMRYLLRVAYDGTEYCGWQIQPGLRTVEGTLKSALNKLMGTEVPMIGASRTDAGVHAEGNVAVFDCDTTIPADKIKYALNNMLPEDVVVVESKQVEDNFHPRHCDCKKTYQYRILNTPLPDPNRRRNTYFYRGSLDIAAMREAAGYIVGTHDFICFMAAGSQVKDTVRTVYSLELERENDVVTMTIQGNGFLYNMVRIIAGTLIMVGRGQIKPQEVKNIIDKRDRREAGPTAPAKGLTLKVIEYE